MAPISHSKLPVAADFEILQNRVALALAKREQLIKSWTSFSSIPAPPRKSQEELDAEDADLLRAGPPRLGLGAPIPLEYQNGEVNRNKLLHRAILGKKPGLQASKQRDAQEKAGSSKRGLYNESSDEDEGRSALGKAKKARLKGNSFGPTKISENGDKVAAKKEQILAPEQVKSVNSNHVPQQAVKTQAKLDSKAENKLSKPSSLGQKKLPTIKRVPLVDYKSDEGDDDDKASTESKKSSSKVAISASPGKKIKLDPEGAKIISRGSSNQASGSEYDIPHDDAPSASLPKPASRPSSKPNSRTSSNGSKNSSIGSASTDSEQSDMEIAIPTPLTLDVVPPASISAATNTSLSVAEKAKKPKNREWRARRRESKKRRKEAAVLVSGNDVASKTPAVSGGSHGKKLKDRLLDANGNGQ